MLEFNFAFDLICQTMVLLTVYIKCFWQR